MMRKTSLQGTTGVSEERQMAGGRALAGPTIPPKRPRVSADDMARSAASTAQIAPEARLCLPRSPKRGKAFTPQVARRQATRCANPPVASAVGRGRLGLACPPLDVRGLVNLSHRSTALCARRSSRR
ncbi:hypothetical protein PsYK624_143100 [Phanerochaete sordida]|uniref:Uncharacterized protein n=1 Tax=Phanerochaete sordida TaxID=48140 RepID=A0A9P3GLN5_9APHY|nr:hypothetical protein PsYK624_143100 [Phanerochaete sordida]